MSAVLDKKAKMKTVVLVGLPNVGKTSLYNALTNSDQKVMNYPGSTVSCSFVEKEQYVLVDSPGISSLQASSPDEQITFELLTKLHEVVESEQSYPDLLLCVVDETQFARQMVLVHQLHRAGFPVALVLSKQDLIKEDACRKKAQDLSKELSLPVFVFNGKTQEGAEEIATFLCQDHDEVAFTPNLEGALQSLREDYRHVDAYAQCEEDCCQSSDAFDWDRYLLHPWLGSFCFLAVMACFFFSIFFVSAPLMEFVEAAFSWGISSAKELLPEHWGSVWFADGLLGGIGAAFVFVPQIALLFIALGAMESSGYLARGAVLVDRPLSLLGMNGRSFVPLLSACACAIPAMMAARAIPCRRERMITLFVIPLMTCSARLPVYGLLLTLLLGVGQPLRIALAMTALYFVSFLLSCCVSLFISRCSRNPKKGESVFQMELPPWQWPQWGKILYSAYSQVKGFLWGVGPLIAGFSMVFWLLSTFPSEEHSFASLIGQWIEPLLLPMGLDWRVGVALLLAFAAREVFVSALLVSFAATGEGGAGLLGVLQGATFQSSGELIFTSSSIIGLLVFFMISMQCMATLAIAKREMGGWKWPFVMTSSYILAAYVLSVSVVQGMRFLGLQ